MVDLEIVVQARHCRRMSEQAVQIRYARNLTRPLPCAKLCATNVAKSRYQAAVPAVLVMLSLGVCRNERAKDACRQSNEAEANVDR